MKNAICIMFPSKKRVAMETNFQNTKTTIFKSRYLFKTKVYMNDIHSA